jgi:hypothetical protein
LGIYETGEYPKLLDDDGMWDWSQQRSDSPVLDHKLARDCTRPLPPVAAPKLEDHLGVANLEGPELDDLKRTGWAVLYGPNTSDSIKKQLEPLIQYRRDQIQNDKLFKIFDGANGGYQTGQTVDQWLAQFRVSSSAQVRPTAGVPFYVMIVAAPDDIPFEFQYQLDVYWGVGRLWLEKDEDYGTYAHAVMEYESGQQPPAARQLTFFAPRFQQDNGATASLCDDLIGPLRQLDIGADFQFGVDLITGKDATRDRLVELYSGQKRPSIYFCGSHGVLRALDSPHLPDTQGALICEVWSGNSPPGKDQYMAARNLVPESSLRGTVHFLFACYAGGWPKVSSYDGAQVGPGPAVARLPQTILAKGGLAVFAHIDRVWTYSFQAGNGIDRTQEYEGILTRIMKGARAGHASDAYNIRWSVLGGRIAQQMRDATIPSTQAAHDLWIEHDDARNHVMYGDPAVCLRVNDMPAA